MIRTFHLACHIAAAVVATAAVTAAAQETLEAVELRLDKALQGGVASEKNWMRTAHLGLTFRGAAAVAGRVGVGRGGRPGGWNVAGWSGRVDRLAVRRENDLNLEVAGDRVSGTHAGTFEDKQGRGAVWGEASPRPPAPAPTQPLDVWLKLEDGLFGGADWQNRAFFSFTVVGGRGDAGTLSNNKGIYTARFDRARLDINGGSLTGTLHGTVLSGDVTAGEYVFELDGWMIGDVLAGRFTTRKGDQTKTGYFVGGVTPASP